MLTLLSGEDRRWLVDSDATLSSTDSDDDEISRPHKQENESNTEFSHSGRM